MSAQAAAGGHAAPLGTALTLSRGPSSQKYAGTSGLAFARTRGSGQRHRETPSCAAREDGAAPALPLHAVASVAADLVPAPDETCKYGETGRELLLRPEVSTRSEISSAADESEQSLASSGWLLNRQAMRKCPTSRSARMLLSSTDHAGGEGLLPQSREAAESGRGRRAVAPCGAPARLSGWARSQSSRPALTCIIGARRAWIVPMISSTSIPCR